LRLDHNLKQRNRHHSNPVAKQDPGYELTDREKSVLKAIKIDPQARTDFDFLRRKIGCSEEFLVTQFTVEAWWPLCDDDLPLNSQMRDLNVFAEIIEDLAKRIQDANHLPFWRFTLPRIDLVEDGELCSEAAFKRLPELLRLYARNIRKKVETERSFRRIDKVDKMEFEVTEALCFWIKQNSGRRYRDRVASVQRVVYRKAGRKRLPASGETLRKRDQRRRLGLSPRKPGTF
jgi:hypothetical protein